MARHLTRLFRPESLFENQIISLSLEQSHHLRHVLRHRKNDDIYVFNATCGQWQALIADDSSKCLAIKIKYNVKPAGSEFPLGLAFAPLKPRAMDFMIEKATELGVTSFYPFWSERTQGRDFKNHRYKIMAQEAAEQSERLSLPLFEAPLLFKQFLNQWNYQQTIYVADERRSAPSLLTCLQNSQQDQRKDSTILPMIVMIGPEGGFTASEFDLLQQQPFCCFVSLSQTILRSETAALCALSLMQAKILQHRIEQ